MPDLKWNKERWDNIYTWPDNGEEWSVAWGGSYPQWIGTIYPRISRFLPTDSILEIAPGYGRWSRFLINLSAKYWGVDIAKKCIENCKERFRDYAHARFIQNDGISLEMIDESSIDFCFSFDSLVHAEIDVMEKYITQIISKLTNNGIAFLHHSNFEEFFQSGLLNRHSRAVSVNANKVYKLVEENFGRVIVQEKINWGEAPENLIDCFTVFCRKDSQKFTGAPKLINNSLFGQEIRYCREVLSIY